MTDTQVSASIATANATGATGSAVVSAPDHFNIVQELKAEIKVLEADLVAAWNGKNVAVIAAVAGIVGFIAGHLL